MEAQATTAIQLIFRPELAGAYSGDLMVEYEGGSKVGKDDNHGCFYDLPC